jgi:hypothetical protein
MTCARAAPDGDFKACCMQAGRYDGANRDDYFQGVRMKAAGWRPADFPRAAVAAPYAVAACEGLGIS